MIFGHSIEFVDEPRLNFHTSSYVSTSHIYVKEIPSPDFEIYTDFFPHSLRNVRYGYHHPMRETKGKGVEWTMEIQNVLTLVWFPKRQTIGYQKGNEYTPERLRFWLYHTFLPLLFQMEELYHILHAGCVEVAGKAVIFMAPSFGGKSTMTDYFLRQGHRLLSDDTLAVKQESDGSYRAVASWPFHRPYREAETLGKETDAFVTEPLEIATVFYLEKVDKRAPIVCHSVQGIEKFKTIHYGSFIPLEFLKEKRFAFHTDFAKKTVVERITVPWSLDRLSEVYESVVERVNSQSKRKD